MLAVDHMALRPAVFDPHVRAHKVREQVRWFADEEPDHRHRRLLRARR